MSTLATLAEKGLDGELIDGIATHNPINQEAVDTLLGIIDKHGLTGIEPLKFCNKQSGRFAKDGIYAFLVKLNDKVKSGVAVQQPVAQAQGPATGPFNSTAPVTQQPVAQQEEKSMGEESVVDVALTAEQDAKVKAMLQKEEEKWQKRKAERERKLRERVASGKPLRGGGGGGKGRLPVGVPADKADRYIELRNQVKACKQVRKEQQALMDQAKVEMEAIRPTPNRQPRQK